jgi:hypothetical protein
MDFHTVSNPLPLRVTTKHCILQTFPETKIAVFTIQHVNLLVLDWLLAIVYLANRMQFSITCTIIDPLLI